ncbi:ATP-dependent Clp protease ATP-binding subunit (plasmid) [Deinococcus metallilatus]|uniref:ATP-dependent Clp protease ATP-binding subunit ClpA n=1 Tax=Deinococcus metallilatus TaxID=1211322 RepID=A0ABR6MQL5_9DEIO|nr:Clp protease N-terminal domain-containing protein [Deinococcus metallilatus]MBB5293561.1 ATP-dependent Clp protease ATP-binding subunit ClpA [Deinococcus metallilatus]QBY06630.1 ATP-dependent Clp protease ATP-binding subunit [Deinococcus metallilatus]RXJ17973.1 ATP-dependent Clp protease ATP-binding subunit [Deinococcus metallilatus]GMA15219.1 hypothetical protein GCM10025871_15500 [Deinococcus metallilatus]
MNLYDDAARLTFHYAREEANALGHAQVGPEHLLLGLMRAEGGGRDVLTALGADLDRMRQQVREFSPLGKSSSPQGNSVRLETPSITPLGRRVMEIASQEARALGVSVTSTPHILLGIVRAQHPVAQRVLASLQADPEVIMERARAAAPPSSAETRRQAQERAAQVQALRHLLEETLQRDGTPPAGMTEDELVALILGGGDESLVSLFEDVVYRWLTEDRLSGNRKHAVLLHLIHHAMQRRG